MLNGSICFFIQWHLQPLHVTLFIHNVWDEVTMHLMISAIRLDRNTGHGSEL